MFQLLVLLFKTCDMFNLISETNPWVFSNLSLTSRQCFKIDIDDDHRCAQVVVKDNGDRKIEGREGGCYGDDQKAICQSFCRPPICPNTFPQKNSSQWTETNADGTRARYYNYLLFNFAKCEQQQYYGKNIANMFLS